MPTMQVESSAIVFVHYDEVAHILEIHFHSGNAYRYYAVPPELVEEFLTTESHGRFYNSQIRGYYDSSKI